MTRLPRIWRSPYSSFGHSTKIPNDLNDETATADAAYTDDMLASIAEQGFDAIWVHGLLRHLVTSPHFSEFGANSAVHIARMTSLIQRAATHGLQVLIYMQPPRAVQLESPFWKAHPDVGGVDIDRLSDDNHPITDRTLCTSAPTVRAYLRDAAESLFTQLPQLGGVILITASEYPSHCYGRFGYEIKGELPCPRCRERHPVNVVTELIHTLRDGIRAASPTAHIICWNWSWYIYEPMPYPNLIAKLPHDVILLSDFERGDTKVILGRERVIDEYALSNPGPSPLFRNSVRIATERNLPTMAKLQIGTTHELATVANLPIIGNLYHKAKAMRELGIPGFMGCWNFGNFPTANTAAFLHFLNHPDLPEKDAALAQFATSYFPGCDAPAVAAAWDAFAEAMNSFPFAIPFIYFGPMNFALGLPLRPGQVSDQSIGRSWCDDHPRGDNMDTCIRDYTLAEIITGFSQLVPTWQAGLEQLADALSTCDHPHAQAELDNATIAYLSYRSSWNHFRLYHLRRHWLPAYLADYHLIAQDELQTTTTALPILQRDPRLGYHSECQAYQVTPAMLQAKITELQTTCDLATDS